jgi:hypothetical protein
MSEIPAKAQARFAKLAKELAPEDGAETAHRKGFGTGSVFAGRKMFAVLDPSGALVLKLPPARVQELIASRVGAPWHPGTGAPLKEYVAIGLAGEKRWLALAKESREYMASQR